MNGPLKFAVSICTVAVLLSFVIVTGFEAPVDPAATGAKATRGGPFTESAVPLPERATLAGAAPLYGTESDPDEDPGVVGENCSIMVQLFFGSTV
jgi:hypothetical protein